MFSRLIASLSFAALLLLPAQSRAELKVAATIPALASLAREIGGEHVSVTSLSLPTQDPHFVDAKPSLLVDLNKADLLLVVGLDLEAGWLPPLLTGARNPAIQRGGAGHLDCSQLIAAKDVPEGRVDRSMGDIHPGGNPHYLFDPRAGEAVARGIAARLAQLDAAHAEAYRSSLDRFVARLGQERSGWEQRMASRRGLEFIGYHKSWSYLADWLGWSQVAFIEPKPGIPPSPSHAAEVVVLARQRKIRLVLQEGYYADTTSRVLSEKMGARLVKVPSGPDFRAGEGYVEWLGRVVTLLEGATEAR